LYNKRLCAYSTITINYKCTALLDPLDVLLLLLLVVVQGRSTNSSLSGSVGQQAVSTTALDAFLFGSN
jgi:hypothetical protein